MTRLLIILVVFLSSCGTVKKVFVKKHSVSDTATTTLSHADVSTTKDIDTVLHFGGDTAQSEHTVDVDTSVEVHDSLETPTQKVKIDIKHGKSKITAIDKPKDVPVKMHEQSDSHIDTKSKVTTHNESTESNKQVEKTGIKCWLLIAGIIVLVLIIAFLAIRFFSNLAPPK
jgi:hypothetical protein